MADRKQWKDLSKKAKIANLIMVALFCIVVISIFSNNSSGKDIKKENATITAKSEPSTQSTPIDTLTVSQKNAVKSAKTYLSMGGFSYQGLIAQLEFEKYTHEDAVYGVDHSNADWNAQASKSAAQYMNTSSYSRDGLISQLIYEKFTREQAEYGANSVGL